MRYFRSTSSYTEYEHNELYELVGEFVRSYDSWNVIRGISIIESNPKLVYKNILGDALLLLLSNQRRLFVEYNKIEVREIFPKD